MAGLDFCLSISNFKPHDGQIIGEPDTNCSIEIIILNLHFGQFKPGLLFIFFSVLD